jgi:hypothetical protein
LELAFSQKKGIQSSCAAEAAPSAAITHGLPAPPLPHPGSLLPPAGVVSGHPPVGSPRALWHHRADQSPAAPQSAHHQSPVSQPGGGFRPGAGSLPAAGLRLRHFGPHATAPPGVSGPSPGRWCGSPRLRHAPPPPARGLPLVVAHPPTVPVGGHLAGAGAPGRARWCPAFRFGAGGGGRGQPSRSGVVALGGAAFGPGGLSRGAVARGALWGGSQAASAGAGSGRGAGPAPGASGSGPNPAMRRQQPAQPLRLDPSDSGQLPGPGGGGSGWGQLGHPAPDSPRLGSCQPGVAGAAG